MKRINPKKTGIEYQLPIVILIAIGTVSTLLILGYILFRCLTYEDVLRERADTEFNKLYDIAERAILFHELDSIRQKVMRTVNQNIVKSIQIYNMDEPLPLWSLWSYGDYFYDTDDILFFDYSIIGNRYTDIKNANEFYTPTLEFEEKNIGLVRIAIATDIFLRTEIQNGLLFLFFVLTISTTATICGVGISKRGIIQPINDIISELNRLGSDDLEKSTPQAEWSIQERLKHVKSQLGKYKNRCLVLAEREKTQLQKQIDHQQHMENMLKLNLHFASVIANQALQYLDKVTRSLREVSSLVVTLDPIATNMLTTAEEGANKTAVRIRELISTANSSVFEVKLYYNPIDVMDFLNSVIDGCRFPAKRKGVELMYRVKSAKNGERETVYSDLNKFRHIVTTLITHVISHSEEGSVLVESTTQSEMWRLTIVDTNSTLSENEFSTIISSTRSLQRGTLDLSVAMQLLQCMRGSITVTKNDTSTIIKLMIPSNPKQCVKSATSQADTLPHHLNNQRKQTP